MEKNITNSINYAPNIIKESSRGLERYSLLDSMFARRIINCVTEIDENSCNSMIAQLLELEYQDPDAEITIMINSPGGSVQDGMCLIDIIKGLSCPVRTVCTGMAASMASLLFSVGNKREMLKSSRLMIHDPRIQQTGGTALELQTISENIMKTRTMTAEILAEASGKSVKEILKLTSKDTFFTAEEAVKFGLADEIVSKI